MASVILSKEQGRQIQAEFKRRGFTQREVADRCDISEGHLSAVLVGRRGAVLTLRLARDISLATGIPLSRIMPSRDGDREGA